MLWFYVLLVPLFRASGDVLYANFGDDVSLPCFFTSSATHLSWYKQVAGEQPQIISFFYKSSPTSNRFYNQFQGNERFSVHIGEGFYNLNISNVQDSDSAMYSCSYTRVSVTIFNSGTLLALKHSSCRSFIQQPDSYSVQPGDSVTLNCTLLTGSSDEHSAYWFKDSEKSHLGILYTSSRQCVRGSDWGSPAHRCLYSLSKRNVSQFDAGMYYCAVASCGHILFGTGTRLSVEGNQSLIVHAALAALVVSLIVNLILWAILCHVSRRKKLHSEGSHHQPETAADTEIEKFTVVQYEALNFKKRQDISSRQRKTEEETIYSRVRCSDLN